MKQIYADSLVEHPGHPDQKVHGGKSKVTGVSYDRQDKPISGETQSASITFHRADKSGTKWRNVHKGNDAAGIKRVERAYKRVNALANPSNKKVLLKRNPPNSWGSVRDGMNYSYGFSRRAGK